MTFRDKPFVKLMLADAAAPSARRERHLLSRFRAEISPARHRYNAGRAAAHAGRARQRRHEKMGMLGRRRRPCARKRRRRAKKDDYFRQDYTRTSDKPNRHDFDMRASGVA